MSDEFSSYATSHSLVALVVHLGLIPPILRWLRYFSLLKYCLEALSVNEINSGLMISDVLQGVPLNVSAVVIMQLVSFLAFDSRSLRHQCHFPSSCLGLRRIVTGGMYWFYAHLWLDLLG